LGGDDEMKTKRQLRMIRKTQVVIIAIVVIILACWFFQLANAQTISFASIDGSADRDMYLYNSSGTQLGFYNTTSTGITLPVNESVIFVFRPQTANLMTDPSDWLTVAFAYVTTNIIAIILILFVTGIILRGR
jgi:hypothetical protein